MKSLLLIASVSLLLVFCRRQNDIVDLPSTALIPVDSISLDVLSILDLTTLTIEDSSFYLLSRQSKEILKTTLQFEPIRRYGSIGHGPGEFWDPYDLTTIKDRLYVIDFSQRKLLEFDLHLQPIDEFFTEYPPFSLLAISPGRALMGTMNMEFEDVYLVDFDTKSYALDGRSRKVNNGIDGVVFHARNRNEFVLRVRPFNNRLDIIPPSGSVTTFFNQTQPEKPDLEPGSEEFPIFKSKIHNGAFLTLDRACVLSGGQTPMHQPVQCFNFEGQLVARYDLLQSASLISVYSDSTLYTYSQITNHIYVYHLGF